MKEITTNDVELHYRANLAGAKRGGKPKTSFSRITKVLAAILIGGSIMMTDPAAAEDTSIRPFSFNFSDSALADLRQRIVATKWPEKETVNDASQGVQLATMKKLAEYWAKDYDWRKIEAKIKALPNFITEIDGLDIHFIHVRSKHKNALPVIITHGWPGSIIEQMKIIGPLTDPTAHGGTAEDAFDVVIPSMPGYGFSGKPTTTGWDQAHIARAWVVLMKRLGYTKFVAQGGDWGALINDLMATQGHPELIGLHTNLPSAIPPEINKAAAAGGPPPSGLSAEEKRAYETIVALYKTIPTQIFMASHPQSLYGIADSPIGVAAWLLDHDPISLRLIVRAFDGESTGLTRDDVLDNNHTVLVDEHDNLCGASLLGGISKDRPWPQEHLHPGCGKRFS